MNFFEQQHRSRKKTRLLILLLALAILAITTALYLIASPLWQTGDHEWIWWNPDYALTISLTTLTLITIGALYRIQSLKGGGATIARALGGREITPSTLQGIAEKRLYNVVEEMAIASGTPIPRIFILDQENAINAFAAGYSLHDAAVAVSRGALENLTRDELQGVIAHEFSHILNGDMRLNIRLIGILGGILIIATIGRILAEIGARSRGGRNNPGPALILAGLAILAIGSIGVLFARLIKAAISRQREYLADASAVQFTRNPQGIAGALNKILKRTHGSLIRHPLAEETSHLFFAQAIHTHLQALFATHPPLHKRIAAILSIPIPATPPPTPPSAPTSHLTSSSPPTPQQLIAQFGQIHSNPHQITETLHHHIHPTLWQHAHHTTQAPSLILALLLAENATSQTNQLHIVEKELNPAQAQHIAHLTSLIPHNKQLRWLLLQTALPALRENTHQQIRQLLHLAQKIILSDSHLTLFELTIETLLHKWLLPNQHHLHTIRSLQTARPHLIPILLSLAQTAHPDLPHLQQAALASSWRLLYPHLPPPPIEPITYYTLHQALLHLATISHPSLKQTILTAATHLVAHDGHIHPREKDHLRLIALILDIPLPL